ncbi:MAG: protein-L-isoaspartate O-methyltransferase, partial [Burkholderiaceae bacterium]|nr:protein-L-isoaspartate O-methyltransferase [Burkholderiaceae bacterium]
MPVPSIDSRKIAETSSKSSVVGGFGLNSGLGLDSAAFRSAMVRKLAASGITNGQVLQAMGSVERHRFVDTALA